MKNYNKLFLSLFILYSQFSDAQTYTLYGDKTFGTIYTEAHPNIFYGGNNQLFIETYTQANINGDKTEPNCDSNYVDLWIIKTDASFNILFEMDIGGSKNEFYPFSLFDSANQNLIVASSSDSYSSCQKSENPRGYPLHDADYWICAVDANSNKLWDKTYGGSNAEVKPQIIRLTNGDLVIGSLSNSPISGDKTVANFTSNKNNYWLVKTDSVGNKIWDNVYGGTGDEISGGNGKYYYFSLLAVDYNNFILAGTTNSPVSGNISDTSRGGMDVWIIKIDSAGNKIWDKRFGGSGDDRAEKIISTPDNGFILCGSTNSPQGLDITDAPKGILDSWVLKIDSLGNKEWDKRYGGLNGTQAMCVQNALGGGFWVSGSVVGPANMDISEPAFGILEDYWIFKIDNLGNKLWDKRFGGPGYNTGSRFIIMPDTSIFLVGLAMPGVNSVKTDSGKAGYDVWVVHFKYDDSAVGVADYAANALQINVTPNPAKEAVSISSKTAMKNIELFDMSGNKVFERKLLHSFFEKIMLNGLGNGVYTLRVATDEGMANKKVVVMR